MKSPKYCKIDLKNSFNFIAFLGHITFLVAKENTLKKKNAP